MADASEIKGIGYDIFMGAIAALVSRAEFDARVSAGERLEFDEGVVIEMANNDSQHDGIKSDFARALGRQLPEHCDVGAEVAFELATDKIRTPDIAVSLSRRPRVPGVRCQGSPDLAIEIVSASDKAEDLETRVRLLLAHGAKAVWVLYTSTPHLAVYRPGQPTRYYEIGDTIANEEPIPQFRLPLAKLFE